MPMPLRYRYPIMLTAMMTAVVAILAATLLWDFRSALERFQTGLTQRLDYDLRIEMDRHGHIITGQLAANLALPLYQLDLESVEQLIDVSFHDTDITAVKVFDDSGELLVERTRSGTVPSAPAATLPWTDSHREVVEGTHDGDGVWISNSIEIEGLPLGLVSIYFSFEALQQRIVEEQRFLSEEAGRDLEKNASTALLLVLVLVLVGMPIALFVAHRLVRPILRLAEHAERFGKGDYDVLIPEERRDELGELTQTFNKMVRRIATYTRDLEDREQRLKAIMTSAVDGIVTIDGQGRIEAINPSALRLLGYERHELLGTCASRLLPPLHRGRFFAMLVRLRDETREQRTGLDLETVVLRRDGEVVVIRLTVGGFESGGRCYFTGILHDITEARNARQELKRAHDRLEERVEQRTQKLIALNQELRREISEHRRAQEKLLLSQQVFDNTSEAIVITRADGEIVDVNEAYLAITGYSREEVIGGNPSMMNSGRHDAAFFRGMWRALRERGSWKGEVWDRRKNGEIYPKWLTINSVYDERGMLCYHVGIFSDITELKRTQEQLAQLAYFDPLTELPNRTLFRNRLEYSFDIVRRSKGKLAILFIDLDHFKKINDSLGHSAGDQLLGEVSQRLQGCLRNTDRLERALADPRSDGPTVARLGGDEFAVILNSIRSEDDAAKVAQRMIDALSRPIQLADQEVFVGASIGIALYPANGDDFETLTKKADMAMYKAKEEGRNCFRYYTEGMDHQLSRRLELETRLYRALDNQEFVLHYQPKVATATGEVVGVEALVRWCRPDGGMVPPLEFIPLAEQTGLIIPMGEWILREACRQAVRWQQTLPRGSDGRPFRVAVNLSARQFQNGQLLETLHSVLHDTGIDPACLELEITESMIIGDLAQAVITLARIRQLGVHLSLDDFGTGYSSLFYLKQLPIQSLKIDRSFIKDLTTDTNSAAILEAIISMAQTMGMEVVAEGVEVEDQLAFLRDKGCHQIQGYLFSPPVAAERVGELVQARAAEAV